MKSFRVARLALAALSLFLWMGIARAVLPEARGWVVDLPNALSVQTETAITQKSAALAKNGGPEVAVCVVDSLEGEDIEGYSIRLADKWKVGKKGKDNGIILLVAMKDRKLRIEVGTGLEPFLNDAKAGAIIRDVIVPSMKRGDYDVAIYNGYITILNSIKGAH